MYAVTINLLLWLCYFSHILSFGLALIAIAVLWLATLRRETWRRHLLHVPILLPQIALPLWFLLKQGHQEVPAAWPLAQLVRYFVRIEALFALGEAQLWYGMALAVLFLVLIVLSCRRGRGEENAFLILALLFTVFYFVSPEGMAGGWLLKNRLSLYPFLVLIPWLSPRLGRRAEAIGAAALALAALVNLGYLVHGYRELGAAVDEYLAGLAPVTPNTRILALNFARHLGRPTSFRMRSPTRRLRRGWSTGTTTRRRCAFFPVRFRRSVVFPDIPGILWIPAPIHPAGTAG